jgi:3-hydroxyisobutyrate dehydrogenase
MTTAAHRAGRVRTAVLGTGTMGSAMARNLAAAGLATTVWDRSPAATVPLVAAGAVVAADVVITMLRTAEVASAVMCGAARSLADGAV